MTKNIYKTLEVKIDQSTNTLTSVIDLGKSAKLQGIHMPSAWTTGDLTFQVGPSESGVFNNAYDADGVEVSISAAASRYISLYSDQFAGARFIKIRSGTSGTPVQQASSRTLVLDIETNKA